MNDCKYYANRMLTSLPDWELKKFKCIIFVVQKVRNKTRTN